jgi:hypothetical protein
VDLSAIRLGRMFLIKTEFGGFVFVCIKILFGCSFGQMEQRGVTLQKFYGVRSLCLVAL